LRRGHVPATEEIVMINLSKRLAAALAASAVALTGCYVIPVHPDGSAAYPVAVLPAPAAVAPQPAPGVHIGGAAPATLTARLYPANETASQHGMVTGTVTNMMTGKGRFVLDYAGELLSGEATRVRGDERRGVANAYGPKGTYMSCDYRMTSAYQGTGTCTLSNGARYTVHLGS
jgi:hypothetical protein